MEAARAAEREALRHGHPGPGETPPPAEAPAAETPPETPPPADDSASA